MKLKLLILQIIAGCGFAAAQSNSGKSTDQTLKVQLTTINGIGPSGISNIILQPRTAASESPEVKAYTDLKHIPDELQEPKSFTFEINRFQFAFQSYRQGQFTKAYFLEKVEKNGWLLADTNKLSVVPLKCSINFVVGHLADGTVSYILDHDNDGDLINDKIQALPGRLFDEDQILSLSIPVRISYAENGKIIHKDLLVTIARGGFNPQSNEISLMFPQYYLEKIKYTEHDYLLCLSGAGATPYFTVLADHPYFTAISNSKRIYQGSRFKIDNDEFKLESINNLTGEVLISGAKINAITYNPNSKLVNETASVVSSKITGDSNQHSSNDISLSVGFHAPPLSGHDINSLAKQSGPISLDAYRGKYIFLDFWATYCAPCIAEMPQLRQALNRFSNRNFDVIGVLDEKNATAAKNLLKKLDITWPTLLLSNTTTHLQGYGKVLSFPKSYLISPEGVILAVDLRGEQLMNELNKYLK